MFFTAASDFGVGSRPAPRSLAAGVASFYTLALPPRCAVQSCACAVMWLLTSVSARGRRRARSTRASPASTCWRFHRCVRCRAAAALLQLLSSSSARRRRRARSTRASAASTCWRFHRCARCRAAAALLQLLSSSSALRRRRALARRERRQLLYAGAFTAVCGAGLHVHFAAASDFGVGFRPSPRSVATRASPASTRWRFRRCAKCELHVLCCSF